MDEALEGQVTRSAAEVYEEFFVPALFREWAAPLADAARIGAGQSVLDVACGTGVLAREALNRVTPGGTVAGLDRNEGMLAIARRLSPAIDWRPGRAEAVPFDDACFDAAVSQFGLMFFEDRTKALKEMWRVLRPGGHLAVAVWDSLEQTPGYAAMTALLHRLFGDEVADALRAPFVLGDRDRLLALLLDAGISDAHVQTHVGTARFPSLRSWVHTDVKGWTLADLIDDAQYDTLQREAQKELAEFVREDGAVELTSPAHVVSAVKAGVSCTVTASDM